MDGAAADEGSAPAFLEQGPKPPARASRAMVSTSHPAVTAAALDVLRSGGNAIDAMLTAIPLQQVLEPQLSTIAGGFAMLAWDGARGEAVYLNAHPDHPQGMAPPRLGTADTSGACVAVPGTVAGLRAAAGRFGTRPWASYFAPAIAAARDGFPMYSTLYGAMATAFDRLVHFPSGRERYLPDGHLVPVGRTFRQPRLAATLARIARPDGVDWFQRGAFAERFVAAVTETGGTMTVADLEAYAPRWITPVPFVYRGHTFVGSPPPDSGGVYCGFALGVLERLALTRLGHGEDASRALMLIARVLAEADAVAARYNADPATFAVPTDALLAPEHLAATARLLDGSFPIVDLTPPAMPVVGGRSPGAGTPDAQHTGSNHLVIVDERGNWVSVLHTGYATDFGTGLVVDGVGVNAANVFPGVALGAGRRVATPMAAVLGLRDGRPWLALGTTGYPPPSVTLVLLNLLEYGMSLPAAIDAPRFRLVPHAAGPRSGWEVGELAVETRVPPATLAGLASLGLTTTPLGDYGHTGAMQAVMRDVATQQLVGVTDPRGAGQAAGY